MVTYNKGDRYMLDATISRTMEPDRDGNVHVTMPDGHGYVSIHVSDLRPWTPPSAPECPTEFGTNVVVGTEAFVLLSGYEGRPLRLVTGSGWYSWQNILDMAAARGVRIKIVTPEQVRSL